MSAASMAGKNCLITGATSGIGAVTARELARMGARVLLVGRDPARTQAAAQTLQQQTGSQVDPLLADLSSQRQVRDLAQQVLERYDRLDVLINNAGALFLDRRESPDGIEMNLALNHLAPFLLTNLLLDLLKTSAPSRVITVASAAHRGQRPDFDDLQMRQGYNGVVAYGRSKMANILFTYELARRLQGSGVTSNTLHPGAVASNFGSGNGWLGSAIQKVFHLFAISPEQGAQTSIYLASSPEVAGVSGQYFVKQRPAQSARASHDESIAARLWQVSAELTGLPA